MNEHLKVFFNNVRNNPRPYIGEPPSLDRLLTIFFDYLLCLGDSDPRVTDWLVAFSDYIFDYYSIETDLPGLSILKYYSKTDVEAFYKFFELLDRFCECEKAANDNSDANEKSAVIKATPDSLTVLLAFLQKVRERPGMYFGTIHPSLWDLNEKISNYLICVSDSDDRALHFVCEFSDYVADHFSFKAERHDLLIIRHYCGESAFEKFFELLDEFTEQRKRS